MTPENDVGGRFDDTCCRQVVFADPTQEEEDVVKGAVTIVTLNSDEICLIHKPSMSLHILAASYMTVTKRRLQECYFKIKSRLTAF